MKVSLRFANSFLDEQDLTKYCMQNVLYLSLMQKELHPGVGVASIGAANINNPSVLAQFNTGIQWLLIFPR